LKEIDRALTSHELIKVRAGGAERADRETLLATICDTLSCAAVHHLGKMLILFRPGTEESTYLAQPKTVSQKRKANEPHTPKKLAAVGKKVTKPSRRANRTEPEVQEKPKFTYSAIFSGDRESGRPSTRPAKTETGRGIVRRSALSLRSGARRGTANAPARKRAGLKRT